MITVPIVIFDQTDAMFLVLGFAPQNIMTPGKVFMLVSPPSCVGSERQGGAVAVSALGPRTVMS